MIRIVEPHELTKLAEIYRASWHLAFAKHFPPENLARVTVGDFEERWRSFFAEENVHSFVYERNSVLLGFVTCKINNDDPAEVVSMMVSPTCIRTGIGRELMEKALSCFLENRCKSAILWVVKENSNARQFYERFGFSSSSEKRFIQRYGIELCQLRYQKQLTGF
ncbi:MAG: GNAT family N-acetyltransferase [Acidiferrobacterales bacterium]